MHTFNTISPVEFLDCKGIIKDIYPVIRPHIEIFDHIDVSDKTPEQFLHWSLERLKESLEAERDKGNGNFCIYYDEEKKKHSIYIYEDHNGYDIVLIPFEDIYKGFNKRFLVHLMNVMSFMFLKCKTWDDGAEEQIISMNKDRLEFKDELDPEERKHIAILVKKYTKGLPSKVIDEIRKINLSFEEIVELFEKEKPRNTKQSLEYAFIEQMIFIIKNNLYSTEGVAHELDDDADTYMLDISEMYRFCWSDKDYMYQELENYINDIGQNGYMNPIIRKNIEDTDIKVVNFYEEFQKLFNIYELWKYRK